MKAVQKGSFAAITQKCNKTANINVKKMQFIHKLTASDTSKTTKRWYYSAAHWHLGDVLVGNITFLWFLQCRQTTRCRLKTYYKQWLPTQQVQGALHQSLDGRKGTSEKHYTLLSIPASAINNRLLIKQSNNPLQQGRFIRPTRYKPPVSLSQIME